MPDRMRPDVPPDVPPDRELPTRVTTPLLDLITQQSMDEDYAHVAQRRALDEPRPMRGRPQRTAAVVVAVFGILVTTAAVQTARNSDADETSRATLVSQVVAGRETVSTLQDEIVRMRTGNEALAGELDAASSDDASASSRLQRLQIRTGYLPVTGEGVRIRVDDPPNADERTAVRDEDLALLVNGLWAAGAEAISINDRRLTGRSSIRNSGSAINVNSVPISPPYTVLAIGDTRTLQADLMDTATGIRFRQIAQELGFEVDMKNEDELSLPAAPPRQLRTVTAIENPANRKAQEAQP